jgi:hypothetical protein
MFTVVTLIFVQYGVTANKDYEYPQIYHTRVISEGHYTAGRPLVIVLPLA